MKLTIKENGRVVARLRADVIIFKPRRKSWFGWIAGLFNWRGKP